MVRFETNNENLGKNGNHNNNKSKRSYPTTPHPVAATKKKRSGNTVGAQQDGNLAMLENNAVQSPQNQSQCHGISHTHTVLVLQSSGNLEQESAEDEEEGGNDSFDREWIAFTQSETMETAPNLESYLQAKSSRQAATENFSSRLDQCLHGLNEAIHDILNDSVVPIHNQTLERVEGCDADIVANLKANHARREALTKCMDDANEKWAKQYQRIRTKIGRMNGSMVRLPLMMRILFASTAHFLFPLVVQEVQEEEENSDKREQPPNGDTVNEDQGDDPDWDELGNSECNLDKIRSFLQARSQFQSSEEALSQNLDEIHEGLKVEVEAIIQVAVDIHDQHHSNCMSMEDDIQYHLMENCKRRVSLQQKVEESAKQAQGVFANLLSRLYQKA
eukprot:scaffold732_cov114-Cylindrotheca_fusiformis.AAC.3